MPVDDKVETSHRSTQIKLILVQMLFGIVYLVMYVDNESKHLNLSISVSFI